MSKPPRATTKHLYIAEHREARGWSGEHFGALVAEAMGRPSPFGKNTVSRWETQARLVKPPTIAAMAKVLGITPEALWSPPGRPSLDAMIADQPDEIQRMAADIVSRLIRRG